VIKPKLTPKQKALAINLDTSIYGTFAEIGAGQETVRHFFRAGGASQTIAKAMSAYDKDFSDAIYGKEVKNRYVTQNRLRKMLRYEMTLIEERIPREKNPGKKFFSYANTVTTINFDKTSKGHGWVGIRYQNNENEDFNEIVIHVKFKETNATLQQETLGSLGVNLIYGAYFYADNPRILIESLYDDISLDRLEIDMIDFSGPGFPYVDNRLMSLQLVKLGMTDAVIFNSEGNNMLPADILYKKNIFAVRGSFRPVTKVNIDMFEQGLEMFNKDNACDSYNTQILFGEAKVSESKTTPPSVVDVTKDSIFATHTSHRNEAPVVVQRLSEYAKRLNTADAKILGFAIVCLDQGIDDSVNITYGCTLIRDFECVNETSDFGKMKLNKQDFEPGKVHFSILSFSDKTIAETVELFYEKIQELIS